MRGGILGDPGRVSKLALVVLAASMACAAARADGPYPEVQLYEVSGVIDGDTIRVVGLGRVRLLGIDAPESVHPQLPVQPCALDASIYLHQQVYRRRVRVEVSPGAGRDLYGRLLAYVWHQGLVNQRMVSHGYAKVERRWRFSRMKEFLITEKWARERRLGIWSENPCP